MGELTIWGRRDSFNVQKVLWLLDERALRYDWRPAGGGYGGLDDPEFLRMNPHGRIPVLRDGAHAIWESHAIVRYLAATYGDDALWPPDPLARSQADRWIDWMLATLQPDFLTGVFWGYYRTPEPRRRWDAIRRDVARCARHFGVLDRQLADRPFLGGERLGLADVCIGVSLYRYYGLDIERPSLPNVERWYARLQARPAYRRNVMLPFGHLKGRLDF